MQKLSWIAKLAYSKNYLLFVVLIIMPLNGYMIAQVGFFWGVFSTLLQYPFLIDLISSIDWQSFHEEEPK